MLEKLNCSIETASSGTDAVELFRRKKFDCVLMDCHMPGLTGVEATAAIRNLESGGRTPIIAITASSFETDRENCFNAGMDHFLTKPLRLEELRKVIEKCCIITTAESQNAGSPFRRVGSEEIEHLKAQP